MVIVLLRVLFGILCIPAAIALMLSPLLFDNPAAEGSTLTNNLAYAPAIYILLYVVSLVPAGATSKDTSENKPTSMGRVLLPLAGIIWYGICLLLLEVVCEGRFACG